MAYRALILTMLMSGLSARLAAQNLLYASYGGKLLLVRSVKGTSAVVDIDGRPTAISAEGFVLKGCEEFFPVFVSVHTTNAQIFTDSDMRSGALIRELDFDATFESPYSLEDVFLVLETSFKDKSRALVLKEIGRLEPNKPVRLSDSELLGSALGYGGNYVLHVFAGGQEVFQSKQALGFQEAMLDRMVAKRITGVGESGPKRFTGPDPMYPAKFLEARVRGNATVLLRIGVNGVVLNPSVVSASDPAFGDEAIKAIRLWRFLPKVRNGRPVETQVEIPFAFVAPGS
jgi:TonB family protein